MDKQSLVTFIVDLLRKGPENQALNAGGPTAGASPGLMPQAQAPQHAVGGMPMTPDEVALRAERG